nr:T9SS type A sorting domain-containing protein [Saprospiraceae bacterium]
DTTIFGPEGACCMNFLEVTLPDVPAGTNALTIEVDTRNGQGPASNGNGQSWVLASTITFNQINPVPLPVELIRFDAEGDSNGNTLLNWTTASEENNDRFEIERSVDGVSFDTVGEVLGNGTTTETSHYVYTDYDASASGSQLFYRLRQVDFDGKSAYSDIELVNFAGNGRMGDVDVIQLDTKNYRLIDNSGEGMSTVELYSIDGKPVDFLEFNKESVIDISAERLASGTYIAVVDGKYSKKILVY